MIIIFSCIVNTVQKLYITFSSYEIVKGSVSSLDKFIVNKMVPRYQKIYGLHAQY